MTYEESRIKYMNSKKCVSKLPTLSERLWTSAARDLFVDDPLIFFLASADSKSTSFYRNTIRNKTIEVANNLHLKKL